MTHARRLTFVSVALLAANGCKPANGLWGSVSELFPLEISRVEVLRNQEAFQISYYNNRDTNIDLVARVSVALDGVDLRNGISVPLDGTTDAGVYRASAIHLAGGEPVRDLPPVKRGELLIYSGADSDFARGEFSMLFENNGGYGEGRDLGGTFSASVQDAGFGDFQGDGGIPTY